MPDADDFNSMSEEQVVNEVMSRLEQWSINREGSSESELMKLLINLRKQIDLRIRSI